MAGSVMKNPEPGVGKAKPMAQNQGRTLMRPTRKTSRKPSRGSKR